MQNSSAFQYLAIDTIHESATNPRRTFEESKLHELAQSIRQHGLIQPITVRPNSEGFQIVAGARCSAQPSLPSCFPSLHASSRSTTLRPWSGRWLKIPKESTFTLTKKRKDFSACSTCPAMTLPHWLRSPARAQATSRLSLLQLIPAVAEAFTQERITASHANLIARLPQESQAEPSSSAGARTGRTKSRTCYPPSIFRLGFRPTSTCPLRMRRSTAKTPPSIRQPELALPAPAALDITPLSSPTRYRTNVLTETASERN